MEEEGVLEYTPEEEISAEKRELKGLYAHLDEVGAWRNDRRRYYKTKGGSKDVLFALLRRRDPETKLKGSDSLDEIITGLLELEAPMEPIKVRIGELIGRPYVPYRKSN